MLCSMLRPSAHQCCLDILSACAPSSPACLVAQHNSLTVAAKSGRAANATRRYQAMASWTSARCCAREYTVACAQFVDKCATTHVIYANGQLGTERHARYCECIAERNVFLHSLAWMLGSKPADQSYATSPGRARTFCL